MFEKKTLIFSFLSFFVIYGCSKEQGGGQEGNQKQLESLNDPLYSSQWHLKNTGQRGGTQGEDINVEGVWTGLNKGEGILVAVIDDGLEIGHPDLQENASLQLSYNYTTQSNDPGHYSAPHGTSVAGIIAARDQNGIGVRGVAPRASLLGRNLIFGNNTTTFNIQDALTRNAQQIHVSNNSWGFVDGTGHFFSMDTAWKISLENGLSIGRGGKGLIYVWSAGNGGTSSVDNSNYDGLTNHYGVISVAAVGDDGRRASYSEKGANLWVSAPSMGQSGVGVTTTDLTGQNHGYNVLTSSSDLENRDYTQRFNGTSASAPMVSGVVALILKANPALGWRDVKLILAQSARKNDEADEGWNQNGAGHLVHHSYGFGVVDALESVKKAATWIPVGPMLTFSSTSSMTAVPLNDGETGKTDTMTVNGSGIDHIEYVEITINVDHNDLGELQITLKRTGTLNTESELSFFHPCYHIILGTEENCKISPSSQAWTFGSSRHLDEPADGQWQLVINEKAGGTNGGTWNGWSLKFYGRAQ